MSQQEILKTLQALLPSQFEAVVLLYKMPQEHLRSPASQTEKSIDLIRYAGLQEEDKENLPNLWAIIQDVMENKKTPFYKKKTKRQSTLTLLMLILFISIGIAIVASHDDLMSFLSKFYQKEKSLLVVELTTSKIDAPPKNSTNESVIKSDINEQQAENITIPAKKYYDDSLPTDYAFLALSDTYQIKNMTLEGKFNQRPKKPNIFLITWAGEGNQEKFWRYKLLRKKATTPWQVIKTLEIQETSYVENIDDWAHGETYHYQVVPILKENKTRGLSGHDTGITPLPAPTDLSITQVDKKVHLHWEWPHVYPVKHFIVYKIKNKRYLKSAYLNGDYDDLKKVAETTAYEVYDDIPKNYDDLYDDNCLSYFYLVRPVDKSNQEGIETRLVHTNLSLVYPKPLNFRTHRPTKTITKVYWEPFKNICDLKSYRLEAWINGEWKFEEEYAPSKTEGVHTFLHGKKVISAVRIYAINKMGVAGEATCLSLSNASPCPD